MNISWKLKMNTIPGDENRFQVVLSKLESDHWVKRFTRLEQNAWQTILRNWNSKLVRRTCSIRTKVKRLQEPTLSSKRRTRHWIYIVLDFSKTCVSLLDVYFYFRAAPLQFFAGFIEIRGVFQKNTNVLSFQKHFLTRLKTPALVVYTLKRLNRNRIKKSCYYLTRMVQGL